MKGTSERHKKFPAFMGILILCGLYPFFSSGRIQPQWVIRPAAAAATNPAIATEPAAGAGAAAATELAAGGRKFAVRDDQRGLSELGADGTILWSKECSSIITAFSASADSLALGLLDGGIELLDAQGGVRTRINPDISRIACVYSIALSPDGAKLAAVSGKGPQRLAVYTSIEPVQRFVRTIVPETIRPQAAAFSVDGNYALSALEGGYRYIDVARRISGFLPASLPAAYTLRILPLPGPEPCILALERMPGPPYALVAAAPGAGLLLRSSFSAQQVDIEPADRGFILVRDDGRYNFGVERR